MFESVDEVQQQLERQGYICDRRIATVVYLAIKLEKPVLVEGPAGVGKTELAKVVAAATGRPLIRLQCYEGLDEAKALYEWEYSKQLLYTQILKEKIADVMEGTGSLQEAAERVGAQDSVFFSSQFIVPRPLMHAITSEEPSALLVDEVDKSDPEFEAFLLEVLSDFQITVPEIGTFEARHRPYVFLTSNDAREMSDALKRRCLHLWIDYPSEEVELRILDSKVPGMEKKLAEDVVRLMQKLRELDLKKIPSISETLDWARALLALNATSLDDELVQDTLNVILKYEADIRKAQTEISRLMKKPDPPPEPAKEPTAAETPAEAPAAAAKPKAKPGAKKGVLH